MPIRICIITGEASGDLYGSLLLKEIKKHIPNIKTFGIGGDKLKTEGMELLYHIKDMSVVGFFELLPKFIKIRKAIWLVYRKVLEENPDLCILIDYPGFNLRFAKMVKKHKIKVVYFILPQIWAWGRGRIKYMKYIDIGISILPFEKNIYKNIKFVGHPLIDIIPNTEYLPTLSGSRIRGRTPNTEHTIALLPGSRKEEIKYNLPIMLKCIKLLNDFNFVLTVAEGISIDWIKKLTSKYNIKIVENNVPQVLSNSALALVASGTATLEATIIGTPMIIIYKVNILSYILARMLVKTKFIGLPNIIANENIVPELIQFNATPKNIIKKINEILAHKDEIIYKLNKVREKLGGKGAIAKTTKIILDSIQK